jgi:site-specific DNA-methyltransferase (cytosine-N4-specific)
LHVYFKLFNSIKDEHEIELARLEIESLVGHVEVVQNFADELLKDPLASLVDTTQVTIRNDESDKVRFQDFLLHEVAYGKVQGFVTPNLKSNDIEHLVKRLGYTREIFVTDKKKSWKRVLNKLFEQGSIGKNCNVFSNEGTIVIRAITNQYFLENCEYVLKITPSLGRSRVIEFADRMFDNLMRFIYRIPASAKARVGKRFLDYLADRDEPSRYLSHGLHPYKGKFHPKMTRALVNIVSPIDEGSLMDNFSGSGTLLVEANLMGLNSFGIDVNPMSVLMANAKCSLLRLKSEDVDKANIRFMEFLESDLSIMNQEMKGQSTLTEMKYPPHPQLLEEVKLVAPDVYKDFSPNQILEQILIAREIIAKEFDGDIRNILYLGLAIAISDLKRKKNKEFLNKIQFVLEDIYRRCFLLRYVSNFIPMHIGTGLCFVGDAGNFKSLKEIVDLDGNVNSPPYSTALDYVKNDLNQLAILGLLRNQDDLRKLEQNMGGNPRAKYDKDEMKEKIKKNKAGFPEYAISLIRMMQHFERLDHAFRLYNFFNLLKESLREQFRVLKSGSKIATVIGNNHFKLTDQTEAVNGDSIELGEFTIIVDVHRVVNNLRSISPTPIIDDDIGAKYGPSLPIKVSVSNNGANSSRSGIFVEIENERVLTLLGMQLGFEPYMIVNRYLEKTLRGNIRYESIVFLRKP